MAEVVPKDPVLGDGQIRFQVNIGFTMFQTTFPYFSGKKVANFVAQIPSSSA